MKQVTGSNPTCDTYNSEISIQIYLDGFSVLSHTQQGQFVQRCSVLDAPTLQNAIGDRVVSYVEFSSSQVALVPSEIFDSASPIEHLLSSGLACTHEVCYVQELAQHSLFVVWAVDRAVSDVLESLLDPSIAFVHSISSALQIDTGSFNPTVVIDFASGAQQAYLLHYNLGRLQDYLAVSTIVATDILYYVRNFELSQKDTAHRQSMTFVLRGEVPSDLLRLLNNYYSKHSVSIVE